MVVKLLKMSLAEAVMVMCVVTVGMTGLATGLLTLSAMQIALDKTQDLGTESVNQCFGHGIQAVADLVGKLVEQIRSEVDLYMVSSHTASEQTSVYAARLLQRGPPTGVSHSDWLERVVRPQLSAMTQVSDFFNQNRIGVIMPPRNVNQSEGLQLDKRDLIMYLSNPLDVPLRRNEELKTIVERIDNNCIIGTADSGGRILKGEPCNVAKLYEDHRPPGSGPCRIAPMFGTLMMGNFPWIGSALTTAPIMSRLWSVVDAPYGQISLICAIPFLLNGQRGVVFSGTSLLRSTRWARNVIRTLPPETRLYGFYDSDDGVRYLLSTSHGEPIVRKRFPAAEVGFQPFQGEIEEHSRRRCDEAEDHVIRNHCIHLSLNYPRSPDLPRSEIWNGSGSEFIVSIGSVGDGQGVVFHTVAMIDRPIALAAFTKQSAAIREDITERSDLIDQHKTKGITIMTTASVLIMLLLAQVAAFLSHRITKPLGVFRKEMEAVARMELDTPVDTASRFSEIRAMQVAFSTMVDNLRVYKAYMPAAVFVPADEQGKTPVSGSVGLSSSTTSLGDASLHTSGGKTNIGVASIPTLGLTTTMNMTVSATCQSDLTSHPLSHLLQVGLRTRKGTVFTIDYNLHASLIEGVPVDHQPNDEEDFLSFLSMALSTIRNNSGIVLSFTPYRMIATWNVHSSIIRHAPSACRCAFAIADSLKSVEPKVKSPWAMALDTGLVKAGIAGDKATKSPVCVGPPIDFTAWVVLLGPIIGARILASGEVVDRVRKHVDSRVVDVVLSIPTPSSSINQPRESTFVYELRGPLRASGSLTTPEYTEGFSAFTKKEFKRARSQLQRHLRHHCDDYQASRLLRLAIHADRNGLAEQQGTHYIRRVIGWESYESLAADITLPEGVTGLLKSQNVDMLLSTRRDDSHDDAESLRKEIQTALESRGSNSESGVTPGKSSLQSSKETKDITSTMMTLTTMNAASLTFGDTTGIATSGLPAREFTDRSNVTWYRSDRMLGKGAYGTVWVGMSDAGEQVALKSLPLNIQGGYVSVIVIFILF